MAGRCRLEDSRHRALDIVCAPEVVLRLPVVFELQNGTLYVEWHVDDEGHRRVHASVDSIERAATLDGVLTSSSTGQGAIRDGLRHAIFLQQFERRHAVLHVAGRGRC